MTIVLIFFFFVGLMHFSKQFGDAMHERHPKCHSPGGFWPADIWESECNPTTLLSSQVLPSWALLSLNCMFVFMCWLLCLVSYNPIGADPKPHLKKIELLYALSALCKIKSINRSFLWIYGGLERRQWELQAHHQTVDSLSDLYLIFSRECFSLEKPPNNSSHNYILYTFLFVTWDDNCVGLFFFLNPPPDYLYRPPLLLFAET